MVLIYDFVNILQTSYILTVPKDLQLTSVFNCMVIMNIIGVLRHKSQTITITTHITHYSGGSDLCMLD